MESKNPGLDYAELRLNSIPGELECNTPGLINLDEFRWEIDTHVKTLIDNKSKNSVKLYLRNREFLVKSAKMNNDWESAYKFKHDKIIIEERVLTFNHNPYTKAMILNNLAKDYVALSNFIERLNKDNTTSLYLAFSVISDFKDLMVKKNPRINPDIKDEIDKLQKECVYRIIEKKDSSVSLTDLESIVLDKEIFLKRVKTIALLDAEKIKDIYSQLE